MQSIAESTAKYHFGAAAAPTLELDPFTFENRQALILNERVDWYLCSRPDAVKLHSQKLPRALCSYSPKRKLHKSIVIKAGPTLTLELFGVLGSGSFAYVFSANVIDTARNITWNKAVKVRQALTWWGILSQLTHPYFIRLKRSVRI